ncbi:hypothetical protein ACH5RR_036177 [Cinchona calisaya]|uniref:Peptidase A2 domain-containing protein n=1 Tax=Cinchona calisaya TaxID=153742 RepID=A0ABD2Y3N2_9GENT
MVVLEFNPNFLVNMPTTGNELARIGGKFLRLEGSFQRHEWVKVNGIDVMAMVDTGATRSFVTGHEVRKLKLDLKENGYRIKVVTSEAQPVLGLATVELTLGPWVRQCKLMVVPLDDFDLILEKEFMATNRIFLVLHLNGVMVADERCPTFLPSFTIAANVHASSSSSGKVTNMAYLSGPVGCHDL